MSPRDRRADKARLLRVVRRETRPRSQARRVLTRQMLNVYSLACNAYR